MKKCIIIILSVVVALLLSLVMTAAVTADTILSIIGGNSDFEISDFYNRVRAGNSKKNIDNQIVVVNIDSVFDRRDLAMLIQEVSLQQPKAIALDLIFDS